MGLPVTFIRGEVLCTSTQIESFLPELRQHFGGNGWVSTQEICEFLEMTKDQSSATMIGKALRRHDKISFRRRNASREIAFL